MSKQKRSGRSPQGGARPAKTGPSPEAMRLRHGRRWALLSARCNRTFRLTVGRQSGGAARALSIQFGAGTGRMWEFRVWVKAARAVDMSTVSSARTRAAASPGVMADWPLPVGRCGLRPAVDSGPNGRAEYSGAKGPGHGNSTGG